MGVRRKIGIKLIRKDGASAEWSFKITRQIKVQPMECGRFL